MDNQPHQYEHISEVDNDDYGVPVHLEHLSDGKDVTVIGDISRLAEVNSQQGDNPFGYLGTCGLVSCKNVLRTFGMDVNEADIVDYAIRHGLCCSTWTGQTASELLGGTTCFQRAMLLTEFGVPATVIPNASLEEVADYTSLGYGVIASLNAGVLYNDYNAYNGGIPNHAVMVIGVQRDSLTGHPTGLYINDSNEPDKAHFVPEETLISAGMKPEASLCNIVVTRDKLPEYA